MIDGVYEEVMWSPWRGLGLEHLLMVGGRKGVTATGLIMRMPGVPAGFRYIADVNTAWRLRRIVLDPLDRPGWTLMLDADGRWQTGNDDGEVTALRGCLDVDLSFTPATNMLILRRLDLAVHASAELCVAYVSVPELQLQRREQRYTRTGERTYRLEEAQEATEFVVDDTAVVLDWPGHYRRVWSTDKAARRLDLERQAAHRERLLRTKRGVPGRDVN